MLETLAFLIHPSDPWPLEGHPEAMNMSFRRDYFHTSAWKGNSPKFAACREFGEVGFSRAVHREFIAAGYGNGGVGLPSEQLLLLSRVARWFPQGPPFSLALFLRRVRGR
jgi:hypothetical protein